MFAQRLFKLNSSNFLKGVRSMSGHTEAEAKAEVDKWIKISIGKIFATFIKLFEYNLDLSDINVVIF